MDENVHVYQCRRSPAKHEALHASRTGDTDTTSLVGSLLLRLLEIRAENIPGLGPILRVPSSTLTALSREAFGDLAHLLRSSHLQQLRNILDDKESSINDRAVALELIKNACIAAGRWEETAF